jgi:hypothetical protein
VPEVKEMPSNFNFESFVTNMSSTPPNKHDPTGDNGIQNTQPQTGTFIT